MPDEKFYGEMPGVEKEDTAFGLEPVTIAEKQFVVTSYSKSVATNETDYTDGYGNFEFSLMTRGKTTASFTIDVRSKADAAEIKTGAKFDYDGITWQIVNPSYSATTGKHTLSFTGNYVSAAAAAASTQQNSGTEQQGEDSSGA